MRREGRSQQKKRQDNKDKKVKTKGRNSSTTTTTTKGKNNKGKGKSASLSTNSSSNSSTNRTDKTRTSKIKKNIRPTKKSTQSNKSYSVHLHGRTSGEYSCGGCISGNNFLKDPSKRSREIKEYKHTELTEQKEKELQAKGVRKIPYIEKCEITPDGKYRNCKSYQGWDESKWR